MHSTVGYEFIYDSYCKHSEVEVHALLFVSVDVVEMDVRQL